MDERLKFYVPEQNYCSSYREDEISATLQTGYHYGDGGDAALIMAFDVYNMADTGNVTKTLNAAKCDSDHTPVVCAAFMGGQGAKERSIAWREDGKTPTLKSVPSGGNTVPDVCYAFDDGEIDGR